jgi:hypothetical protein
MPTPNPTVEPDYVVAVSSDNKALLALDSYLRKQFKMRTEIHPCEQGFFLLYRPLSEINRETLAVLISRCDGFLAGLSAKEGAL